MKDIITKYLNRQYRFTLSTYVSYKLYDRVEKCDVGLKSAINDTKKVFEIDEDELLDIFNAWADQKAIEIQNRITDLRYKIYQATGLELELTTGDLNKMIEDLENNGGHTEGEWEDKL